MLWISSRISLFLADAIVTVSSLFGQKLAMPVFVFSSLLSCSSESNVTWSLHPNPRILGEEVDADAVVAVDVADADTAGADADGDGDLNEEDAIGTKDPFFISGVLTSFHVMEGDMYDGGVGVEKREAEEVGTSGVCWLVGDGVWVECACGCRRLFACVLV